MEYCLPIQALSWEDALATARIYVGSFGAVEIWIDDCNGDPPPSFLHFVEQACEQIIVVSRRPELQPPKHSVTENLARLRTLAAVGARIDLDYMVQRELLERLRLEFRKQILLSFHRYDLTPEDDELRCTAESMLAFDPGDLKIATWCRSEADALRLLQLLLVLRRKHPRVTVLGMGEHGQITRIFGSLWGNALLFAPVEREGASAVGQLTRREYETIFSVLYGR